MTVGVIQGIGLAYATSNRGACHLRGYTIASEVLGIPVKTEPADSEGNPSWSKPSRMHSLFRLFWFVRLHNLRLGLGRFGTSTAGCV